MQRITRRKFIKLTAAVTGAMAVGTKITVLAQNCMDCHRQIPGGAPPHMWVPTCCNICGSTTSVLCNVVDGRVTKIEPSPDSPIGISNVSADFLEHKKEGAAVCPKGNAGIMALYDPDRVRKPLKRTNPAKGRGVDPMWKEISWDEAVDEITSKLKSLKDSGEAHKLMWFSEEQCFTHIQEDFCNLYGTPNFSTSNSDASRKAAFRLVMGDEQPLVDAANARYMLFFGWNPLSSLSWAYLPRIITKATASGAKLVVVDPASSMTAAKADEWVPIKPGTDGALALAMGNVIIKEDLHDKEFIDKWTYGFDKYAEYVKDKTPEWAEKICGVPAEKIRRIAIEFATTKPAIVEAGSGVGQHSNGVQAIRAIALLAVLTGQVDKSGTLINPNRKGNEHQKISYKKSEMPRLDGLGTKYPFADPSGIYCESFNRLLNGDGIYQPKMGVFVFQNPVLEVPGTGKIMDAIKKFEYVVCIDTHLTETAELADIVIPGTTYFERYELNTHGVSWPVVGLRQPVVPPIFGQMPEYDFISALGKKLGLKDASGKAFFDNLNYEDYLSRELENGGPKITLKQLKALPGATWVDKNGTEYEKFMKEASLPDGAIVDGSGIAKDKNGTAIGVKIGEKVYVGFATATRKLQFYAPEVEGKKDANGNPVNPLSVYMNRDWLPSSEYPLYLVSWEEVTHTKSRTFNNPWLVEIRDWNPVWINSVTAQSFGIKDGDEIWVESPHSRDKARARVTEGIMPDAVGLQHGFGHWEFGELAKGKGTNDSQFNELKADPISGNALHKEVCVKVYKAQLVL